jgi:hypothetical protein
MECPNCGSNSVGTDDESIPIWHKCCECGYESSEADDDWGVV